MSDFSTMWNHWFLARFRPLVSNLSWFYAQTAFVALNEMPQLAHNQSNARQGSEILEVVADLCSILNELFTQSAGAGHMAALTSQINEFLQSLALATPCFWFLLYPWLYNSLSTSHITE
jgi:hypothetical protein